MVTPPLKKEEYILKPCNEARVEDEIKWCIEFLEEYGHKVHK